MGGIYSTNVFPPITGAYVQSINGQAVNSVIGTALNPIVNAVSLNGKSSVGSGGTAFYCDPTQELISFYNADTSGLQFTFAAVYDPLITETKIGFFIADISDAVVKQPAIADADNITFVPTINDILNVLRNYGLIKT